MLLLASLILPPQTLIYDENKKQANIQLQNDFLTFQNIVLESKIFTNKYSPLQMKDSGEESLEPVKEAADPNIVHTKNETGCSIQ